MIMLYGLITLFSFFNCYSAEKLESLRSRLLKMSSDLKELNLDTLQGSRVCLSIEQKTQIFHINNYVKTAFDFYDKAIISCESYGLQQTKKKHEEEKELKNDMQHYTDYGYKALQLYEELKKDLDTTSGNSMESELMQLQQDPTFSSKSEEEINFNLLVRDVASSNLSKFNKQRIFNFFNYMLDAMDLCDKAKKLSESYESQETDNQLQSEKILESYTQDYLFCMHKAIQAYEDFKNDPEILAKQSLIPQQNKKESKEDDLNISCSGLKRTYEDLIDMCEKIKKNMQESIR